MCPELSISISQMNIHLILLRIYKPELGDFYRLYIKQAPSRTSIEGHESEPEWEEYKIKETNMFTVDKYQQVNLFFSFFNYTKN